MALIRAVAFDFGHTLVDEQRDASVPLDSRTVHLMPEVSETLPRIPVPLAVWANTRTATGRDLQRSSIEPESGGSLHGSSLLWTPDFENPHRSSLSSLYASAGLPAMKCCSSATN